MAGERLRLWVLLLLFTPQFSSAQDQLSKAPSRDDPVDELRKLQEASDWEGILRRFPSEDGSADHCFYRGLAFSRLRRWEEARKAFEAGGKATSTYS